MQMSTAAASLLVHPAVLLTNATLADPVTVSVNTMSTKPAPEFSGDQPRLKTLVAGRTPKAEGRYDRATTIRSGGGLRSCWSG